MSRLTVKKHEIIKAKKFFSFQDIDVHSLHRIFTNDGNKILFHPVQSIRSYIFGDSLA